MDLGLQQKEVALELGVSAETVLGWEIRSREPAIRHWPAILAFLGYDPLPAPGSTAERLKSVRRRQGWSQRELAKTLGVDPTAVRDWEGGQQPSFVRCRNALRQLFEQYLVEDARLNPLTE
jgi:transcriptional regulator with XRE-family HTH domain